jgi:hypothetical protein
MWSDPCNTRRELARRISAHLAVWCFLAATAAWACGSENLLRGAKTVTIRAVLEGTVTAAAIHPATAEQKAAWQKAVDVYRQLGLSTFSAAQRPTPGGAASLPQGTVAWREKVVYYDPFYDTAHIQNPERLADYLAANGFQRQGAKEFGEWIQQQAARDAYGTVAVMTMGAAPSSVFTAAQGRESPLFRYLLAGGRVLWLGDIALMHFQGQTSASLDGTDRAMELAGIRGGWNLKIWGNSKKVGVTPLGRRWGLSRPIRGRSWRSLSTTSVGSAAKAASAACITTTRRTAKGAAWRNCAS